MKKEPAAAPPQPPGGAPFDRFAEFARKVIAVPKSEIEERERIFREDRARKRTQKGSAES
jgi:hypothetical protein